MVYLNHISELKAMYVPKCREKVGDLILSIKNTTNLSVHKISDMECDEFGLQYLLKFHLPSDFPLGEYEYSLMDDDGLISTGILIIEDYACPKEYHTVIQYEQR